MKNLINFKLFVMIITIVLITVNSFAQQPGFDTNVNKTRRELTKLSQKSIKLDLAITVNNKSIDDTSYVLNIVNYNTGVETNVKVSNKFILFLQYDIEFEISVSYKGTNMKTIIVNTNAPENNWYVISGINLSTTNHNRILAGGLKYDKLKDTFIKY